MIVKRTKKGGLGQLIVGSEFSVSDNGVVTIKVCMRCLCLGD